MDAEQRLTYLASVVKETFGDERDGNDNSAQRSNNPCWGVLQS